MSEAAFLLDSNILIYILQARSKRLRARVEACAPGEIVTSAVSFAEVIRGVRSPAEAEGANALARRVPVLPFGVREAQAYATLPFRRHRFDRLIGAHALALDLTLVTNNARDFADIPDLRIEDWTA